AAGNINAILREPLSGTMNTTEATVFRRPTVPASGGFLGKSQETGISSNPLNGDCVGGVRKRGIGTGEAVKGGLNSGATDSIGYAFFSYGNVTPLAGNANFGYITLNGIDPIFQTYGSSLDPGQPATDGVLPLNTPCGSGTLAFPCSETKIWAGKFSFPNLRNGLYRAWSVLRIVTDASGPNLTSINALVSKSQIYVVTTVPDYVPFAAVTGTVDLGLKLVRSHYQQKDGDGTNIGTGCTITNSGAAECGGDMGGQILPTLVGVATAQQTQLVQNGSSTNLGPKKR